MPKIRKKDFQEQNVFEATLDRIRYLYKSFDEVVVSFSAGKDSTTVLNLALIVAKELGKKLTVDFFDEEAIHPPTIEYAKRIAANEDIIFNWYCLEFKHRNACSNEEPFWYTWEKGKEDIWVREMPDLPCVIKEHPKFKKGMSFQEFSPLTVDRKAGSTAILTGIRTEESIRRYRTVANKKNDNYITRKGHFAFAHPIYDWSSNDVWLAVHKYGWDYNKTYDVFNQTKLFNKFLNQRVCPPFGEEPLRGLWIYSECFPEMWHKMLSRVKGVATAWRYANTDLYGYGKIIKPEGVTYKKWVSSIIETFDAENQKVVKRHLNGVIRRHTTRTNDIVPDLEPHPLSGVSWSFISKLALKGDFKDRTSGMLDQEAQRMQEKLGITLNDAVQRYGTQEFKREHFKNLVK